VTHEELFWRARAVAIQDRYREIALDKEPEDMEWHLRTLAAKMTDESIKHMHAITAPPRGYA
jgi:hypothetical protein